MMTMRTVQVVDTSKGIDTLNREEICDALRYLKVEPTIFNSTEQLRAVLKTTVTMSQ